MTNKTPVLEGEGRAGDNIIPAYSAIITAK